MHELEKLIYENGTVLDFAKINGSTREKTFGKEFESEVEYALCLLSNETIVNRPRSCMGMMYFLDNCLRLKKSNDDLKFCLKEIMETIKLAEINKYYYFDELNLGRIRDYYDLEGYFISYPGKFSKLLDKLGW